MLKAELEAIARDFLRALAAGRDIEGSTVECKRDWPEAKAAAKQLAAHANASQGETFVWLIGVDEKGRSVAGAPSVPLEPWVQSVAAEFDGGVAPELQVDAQFVDDLSGEHVVALAFVADSPPYVAKSGSGGFPELVVPWRIGSFTRAATRSQLLRMLVPQSKSPTAEILSVEAHVMSSSDPRHVALRVEVQVFVTPHVSPTVFPNHLCWLELEVNGVETYYGGVRLRAPTDDEAGMRYDFVGATVSAPSILFAMVDGPTPTSNVKPYMVGCPTRLHLVLRTAEKLTTRLTIPIGEPEVTEKFLGRWNLPRKAPWDQP